MSGRAASIGLEDRFRGIKDQEGVRQKLAWLIGRLAGVWIPKVVGHQNFVQVGWSGG